MKERLGKKLLFLDGGMGSLLQERGLTPGELPETWNLTHAQDVTAIHKAYIKAGSDIVLTNTFGANALKFHDDSCSLEEIVTSAVQHVKQAAAESADPARKVYTALDVGPTGKLLKPMGELDFEEAYEAFREVVCLGERAGADLIYIETMSDTYELKAAVLAAKENTSLPVFATTVFDERGKLLTGADVASTAALLEGLRVDAMGMNCGLGPKQMLSLLEEMRKYSSLPIIIKPNAGLPAQRDGKTVYDVEPEAFAETMQQLVEQGASVIGGCCGTTPEHIREMVQRCTDLEVCPPEEKQHTIVSSYGNAVVFGEQSRIIGERINPTGKKRLKEALKTHNLDYILKEAIMQEEKGAHILDVNVGLPDIDEKEMMQEAIAGIQSVTSLPLQIDTVDIPTMEAAMRMYNGKPMVNSVSGKKESMDAVFPLIQRYGGVVIGLTLDEAGIPDTAEGRTAVARKIIEEAAKYGIRKKDIVIDVLAMTVSSDPKSAKVTLDALRQVREELGVHTVLGVSNISFGLPTRPVLNSAFYTLALYQGLSAGILNPSSEDMMKSYRAYHALLDLDANFESYIQAYGGTAPQPEAKSTAVVSDMTLRSAIEKGLREESRILCGELGKAQKPLEIIQEHLIPALDNVGKGFEKGSIFLPQLMMSAEAAKAAFEILKENLAKSGEKTEKQEKIVLATVKGDIHDIGKNIVKVLLENYSFDVIDLGKDVSAERILEVVKEQHVPLVGLSALMTTTVASMEETIQILREQAPWCKVMVGGAVLNQEYADMIGADFYGRDAMQSVRYAEKYLKQSEKEQEEEKE